LIAQKNHPACDCRADSALLNVVASRFKSKRQHPVESGGFRRRSTADQQTQILT